MLPQRGRVNKQLASCLNYGARFTCDYEGAFDGECQQKRNFVKKSVEIRRYFLKYLLKLDKKTTDIAMGQFLIE